MKLIAPLFIIIIASLGTGCANEITCNPGEFRYTGRPPRSLFAYDLSCRADCFSLPQGNCPQNCSPINVAQPQGYLTSDRSLSLIDTSSLQVSTDGSVVYGLVFTFGYIDEAGGAAPAGWDLLTAGPREYLANNVQGTARFVMQSGVYQLVSEADGSFTLGTAITGPRTVKPGRLDILETSQDRLRGQFFIGFETETLQPQGQIHGCFDASLGASQTTPSGLVQRTIGF